MCLLLFYYCNIQVDIYSVCQHADIHYNLEISFEEAILGCKKVISIEKDRRCQCYEQDGHCIKNQKILPEGKRY